MTDFPLIEESIRKRANHHIIKDIIINSVEKVRSDNQRHFLYFLPVSRRIDFPDFSRLDQLITELTLNLPLQLDEMGILVDFTTQLAYGSLSVLAAENIDYVETIHDIILHPDDEDIREDKNFHHGIMIHINIQGVPTDLEEKVLEFNVDKKEIDFKIVSEMQKPFLNKHMSVEKITSLLDTMKSMHVGEMNYFISALRQDEDESEESLKMSERIYKEKIKEINDTLKQRGIIKEVKRFKGTKKNFIDFFSNLEEDVAVCPQKNIDETVRGFYFTIKRNKIETPKERLSWFLGLWND